MLNLQKTSSQVLAEEQSSGSEIDFGPMLESSLLSDYVKNSLDTQQIQQLRMAQHVMAKTGYLTLKPLLPLLLSIRGKPYHLHDHFPFAPFFRTRMPRTTLLKT